MSTTEFNSKSSSNQLLSLTPLYLIGLLLAAITGVVHLWLGIEKGSPALFIAGIGFAIGIIAVVVDIRRQTIVRLGIPFTAVQAVYYLATHFDQITWVSATDKLVQVGLIAVLIVIDRRG
ncbi:hypothetical protein HYG81_25825 (plasmid) [Natrinema zhouii]|uniref:hypothetical protein n=1 Tax=Natrinema zhouii TaxID=1710539 RepID=UPI001D0017A8|nr:hypothetical protein [Natrinema zhouii]UHQ99258.1 hypothetical protein HYG81_25825 [Natrinema zhouii]